MAGELAVAVVARAVAAALRPYAQAQLASGEFAAAKKAWELAVREDGVAVFHSAAAVTEHERAEAAGTRWAPKAVAPTSTTSDREQQRTAAVRPRPTQAAQSTQRRR